MKKREYSGIELSYHQKIRTSSSKTPFFLNLLLDWICITLLVYGSVCGFFATCGAMRVGKASAVEIAAIVLFTLIVFELKKIRKYCIIGYFTIALAGIFLFHREIMQGAQIFANYYMQCFNEYFAANYEMLQIDGLVRERLAVTAFMLLLAWIQVLWICFFKKMYKKTFAALILSIVIFFLIFMVGLVPEFIYLFTFLLGFFPLSIKVKWKDSVLGIQAKLTALIIIGILAIVCMMGLPRNLYEKNMELIQTVKQDIQGLKYSDAASELSYYFSDSKLFKEGGVFRTAGGLYDGRLGRKDKITYDRQTDFIFTDAVSSMRLGVELDSDIYLRSYVGARYTDKSWKSLEKSQQKIYKKLVTESGYQFENLLTDFYKLNQSVFYGEIEEKEKWYDVITIEKRDIGKNHALLPYGIQSTIQEKDGYVYTKESHQKKKYQERMADPCVTSRSYLMDITSMLYWHEEEDAGLSRKIQNYYNDFYKRESIYRDFVYDAYTDVPGDVAPRFQSELRELLDDSFNEMYYLQHEEKDSPSIENAVKVYEIAQQCKEFLKQRADYSLEPGRVPEEADFIDYFLYENQLGYCTYFATTAVLYMRLCGVPARYVEGYRVQAKDLFQEKNRKKNMQTLREEYTIKVTDEAAHAWIEVYINGVGWVPVDVTPGYSSVRNQKEQNSAQNEESQSPSLYTSTMPSPSISPSPTPSKQSVKEEELPGKDTVEKKDGFLYFDKWSSTAKYIVLSVLVIVMLISFILIRRYILCRKHRIMKSGMLNNKKVKYYYYQVNRMAASCSKFNKKREFREQLELIQLVFSDIPLDDFIQFVIIVERATFGGRDVSDYDCMKARKFYEDMKGCLYKNVSGIKKVYYKNWKVF